MNVNDKNFFVRHKKKTLIVLISCFSCLSVAICELVLQEFMGLGNPIIYDSSPIYGYRPLPNKDYTRLSGAKLKFNNLGLRANKDWNEDKHDKILFLGDSVTYGGSYIDNEELFSYLAVELLNKTSRLHYTSGNAGVNAWGVENIYGLIKEFHFLPATMYITTLPEGDFYRGLTRLHGLPFFNKKPTFALQELWYYFCYLQNDKRYVSWKTFLNEQETTYVLEKAVKKLKEMDVYLKDKGYKHLIFITPSKAQVMEGTRKDTLIYDLLAQHELAPYYIIDDIAQYHLSLKEKEGLFHDAIHLTKKGHELWATIIATELKNRFTGVR